MKMAVTLRAFAPIVFRIATSRCFSITRRIRVATIFSAATSTMSPTASETAIFSSVSAEKSDLFITVQSSVKYWSPSCFVTVAATCGALVMSSTRNWIKSTCRLSNNRIASWSDTNA